jgi:hypothetical protein
VIAQDVQAVFPELVKPASHGYLTVNYRGLAAKIGEAVIELRDRIEAVKELDERLLELERGPRPNAEA